MKTPLQILREELVQWERDFKSSFGRKPSSKDTPQGILMKYKELIQLQQKEKEDKSKEELDTIVLPKIKPIYQYQHIEKKKLEYEEQDEEELLKSMTNTSRSTIAKSVGIIPKTQFIEKQNEVQTSQVATTSRHVICMDFAVEEKKKEILTKELVENDPGQLSTLKNQEKKDEDSSLKEVSHLKEKVRPPPTSSTTNTLFSGFKSQPNFVRMNLKKDWKSRRRHVPRTKKKMNFSNDEEEKGAREEKPDDVVATANEILDNGNTQEKLKNKIPRCGHDLPCNELVVKKTSTGNKGRIFYGCSFGREASCGFFQWKDDTSMAAKEILVNRDAAASTTLNIPPTSILSMSTAELKLNIERLGGESGYKSKKKAGLIEHLQNLWMQRYKEAKEFEDLEDLQEALETVFFHEEFLPGQQQAIEAVLENKNTLVIRATGSGKSLIYQLPAFIFQGLTLVISPLISLMIDQASQLPPGLTGVCLTGTQKEQAQALNQVISGQAKILYISPERLFTSSFQTFVKKLQNKIALVCIDEAHCLSSWSHNFRPAYLRLGDLLPKLFPTSTILALTATATLSVQEEIKRFLNIQQLKTEGTWMRNNLVLKVESTINEEKRLARLVEILSEGNTSSSIVYTTTKNDTNMIAERLKNAGIHAAPYHSGLELAERKKVQAEFIRSKIPVVVATVAFGMGLNKSNIRRIIHYRTPRSVEEYVQEIGRAGRDGKDSDCICWIDEEEAKRHVSLSRSDGVDKLQVEALLEYVQHLLKNESNEWKPIFREESTIKFDIREGALETILVFLEKENLIELGQNSYGRIQINFSSSEKPNCPPIVKLARKKAYVSVGGKVKVDLDQLLTPGTTVSSIIRELCVARDSDFIANFTLVDSCWYVKKSIINEWNVHEKLQKYCDELEMKSCLKGNAIYSVLSLGIGNDCKNMKQKISEYLETESFEAEWSVPWDEFDETAKRAFSGDVISLLRDSAFLLLPKHVRTPRAIVRIFHSISSPVFSFETWSKHRLWGRYKRYDFQDLLMHATEVVNKTRSTLVI